MSNTIIANPTIIGAKDLSGGVTLDAAHNSLVFKYDGYQANLELSVGSYSEGDLVTALQNEIDLTIGNPKITGSHDLKSGLVTINASNNTLAFDYNEVTYNCNLTLGSYNNADLLVELQGQINSALESQEQLAGSVTASYLEASLL